MTDILPILVPQGTQADLAGEATRVLAMRPTLEAIVCETPQDEQFLADTRQHIAERLKVLEAQRKTIAVPLDQAKKAVDALFRPARQAYEALDDMIRARLSARETQRREATRLAQEQARALAAAGDLAAAEKALPAVADRPEGVVYVESWELESVDLPALLRAILAGTAPVGFVTVVPAAVKEFLRTYKNSSIVPDVPGLTFKKITQARRGA